MWRNLLYNPVTSFGAVICLCGLVLCFMAKGEVGTILIGTGSTLIGAASKDSNNKTN